MASLADLRAKRSRVEELEQLLSTKTATVEELESKVCSAKEKLALAKRALELPNRIRQLEATSKEKDARISELLRKIGSLLSWDESGSVPAGPKLRILVTGVRGLKETALNGGRMVVRLKSTGAEKGLQAQLEGLSGGQTVRMSPMHVAASFVDKGSELQLGREDEHRNFHLIGVALVSLKSLARRPGAAWLQLSSHLPKHVCDIEVEVAALDESGKEILPDLARLNGKKSAPSNEPPSRTAKKPAAFMNGAPKINSNVLPYKRYQQPIPSARPSQLPRNFA